MAPVRRRTTALLVVAGLLLVAVVGLTWLLVGGDDPGDGTAAGVPLTTAGPAAGAAPTTAAGPTTAEGGSPAAGDTGGGDAGSGTSGPPAPPAPACAGVLSGAEAAAALGGSVARVESRDGFLVRACTFRASGDRYLLVQVSRGVAASRDQYELSRLPGDRNVAGIGQAARWTRDTGLLDVLDGPARFQVGLFTPAGTPAAAEPSARLEAVARAVAAHL
ncbi:MAG TPA: hypothetical protein VOA19_04710 [Actinomycetes bacterium]|jgi:hypothetical protein|nr:hypothetical protein [Actinomycetes bacterium]